MLAVKALRFAWGLLALALLAGACASDAAEGFASAPALARALTGAGASVEETAVAAPAMSQAGTAHTWRVDGELVYVYEIVEAAQVEALAATISSGGRTVDGVPFPWSERVVLWSSGRVLLAYEGTDGGLILLLSGLLGDPLTVPSGAPQEPYPPAVTSAVLTWAESLGIDPATVEVISYTSAEWASRCLGLPAAGEACAEVITPGWLVELRTGERTVSAHTDELGAQVRFTPAD